MFIAYALKLTNLSFWYETKLDVELPSGAAVKKMVLQIFE